MMLRNECYVNFKEKNVNCFGLEIFPFAIVFLEKSKIFSFVFKCIPRSFVCLCWDALHSPFRTRLYVFCLEQFLSDLFTSNAGSFSTRQDNKIIIFYFYFVFKILFRRALSLPNLATKRFCFEIGPFILCHVWTLN